MKLRKIKDCWYGIFNSAFEKTCFFQHQHLAQLINIYLLVFIS